MSTNLQIFTLFCNSQGICMRSRSYPLIKSYIFTNFKEYFNNCKFMIPTYSTGNPLLDFFFTLFNGIAEVPLFSSPITGILILAGVFLASRTAGAMMVLSGLIGAGIAILAGAPYGLVTFGLFCYNSILTGMAFWSGPFVKANRATLFISVFGAAITAVTWMAFSHLMGDLFVLN